MRPTNVSVVSFSKSNVKLERGCEKSVVPLLTERRMKFMLCPLEKVTRIENEKIEYVTDYMKKGRGSRIYLMFKWIFINLLLYC